MKKIFKIVCAIFLCTCIFSTSTFHASSNGTMSIKTSNFNVYIGNTFTITITASCPNGIGGVIGYLEYSSSYLTLTNTNAGDDYNSQNGKLIFDSTSKSTKEYTFTFTTKKIGQTTVSFHVNDFIDYENGDSVTGYANTVSRTITISKKPAPVVTKSNNCSLQSLQIEGIEFDFAADILEYSFVLDEKIDSLNIKATPSDGKAKVLDFDPTLTEGDNQIIVVCEAEDTSKKEYVINVYVPETPSIYYQLDNKTLGVVKRVKDDLLPNEGFSKETITIKQEEVTIFNKDQINVIYLIDQDNIKSFYLYDKDNDNIIDVYQPIIINGKEYYTVIFDYSDFIELDKIFEPTIVSINEQTFNAWKYKDEQLSEYKLVYLKTQDGKCGLYRYDVIEKVLQRYYNDAPEIDRTNEAVYLAAAITSTIISIVAIVLLIKVKKEKKVK